MALSAALSLVSCGGNSSSSSTQEKTAAALTTGEAVPESTAAEEDSTAAVTKDENGYTHYPTPADVTDLSGVDLSKPDITIYADEYDNMMELAKQIQNYALEGVVVEINGVVNSGMSHSINVQNADSSKMIGTTIQVVGFQDSDYPPDKTSVHIVGIIRPINEYAHGIIVPKDKFEVTE